MTSNSAPLSLKNGFSRVVLFTLALLLIPFFAMQITNDVQWSVFDFAVMATLLISAGTAFVLLVNRFPAKKLLIAASLLIITLYIWVELAVGVFTSLGS